MTAATGLSFLLSVHFEAQEHLALGATKTSSCRVSIVSPFFSILTLTSKPDHNKFIYLFKCSYSKSGGIFHLPVGSPNGRKHPGALHSIQVSHFGCRGPTLELP